MFDVGGFVVFCVGEVGGGRVRGVSWPVVCARMWAFAVERREARVHSAVVGGGGRGRRRRMVLRSRFLVRVGWWYMMGCWELERGKCWIGISFELTRIQEAIDDLSKNCCLVHWNKHVPKLKIYI